MILIHTHAFLLLALLRTKTLTFTLDNISLSSRIKIPNPCCHKQKNLKRVNTAQGVAVVGTRNLQEVDRPSHLQVRLELDKKNLHLVRLSVGRLGRYSGSGVADIVHTEEVGRREAGQQVVGMPVAL